jgi:flagellar hook-associated protein 2
MGLASPGIGSNLDIDGIIGKLMAVEQQPLTTLAKKEAGFQAKIAAFGGLNGALSSFQNALSTLSNPAKFKAVTASPADATILSSTATSAAVAGNYSVNVTQLAQAQTITSGSRASTTAPLADGAKTTLTFQFGTIAGGKVQDGVYQNDPLATQPAPTFTEDATKGAGTVVIDSSNNSLQGIRDAINKANIGVTATIVSDGSATPYRLVFTSNATGAASSMKISVARDPLAPPDTTLSDLLAYDPAGTQNLTQTAAAQDSKLTVNGIAVTAKSKDVSEAIQGVTLSLSKIGSTTVAVARDTGSVTASVNTFIKSYNDLNKTIQNLTAYDADKKTGGPLLGDSSVLAVQSQLRAMLGGNLPDASGALKNLPAIGVTFQKDGSMAVDTAKLNKAIADNFDDVAGLFTSTGAATDVLIKFSGNSATTPTGTSAVRVNALATRGTVTGTSAPNTLTISAGTNDLLSVTIGDISTTVTLAAGTYTTSTLVTAMQSALNGASDLVKAGMAVGVTADAGGILTITNNRYGSTSDIHIGGSAALDLLPSAVATKGTDVAGTINGVPATGEGQFLSNKDGLKLEITGGLAPADRGTVTFSRGFAELTSDLIGKFTGTGGLVTSRTDGLQNSIKSIGTQRDALTNRLVDVEKRYRAQFLALDAMISKMRTTSDYLTQQLASMSAQLR